MDEHDTPHSRAATAQLTDLLLFRRSAVERVREASERAVLILVTVYAVTVLFNLIDVVRAHGWPGLTHMDAIVHAFFLDAVPTLLPQLRSAAPPVAGAVVLAMVVIIFSPLLYRLVRARMLGARLRAHKAFVRWWASEIPGVSLDDLETPATLKAWLREESDRDAPRRIERLHQIEQWFQDDPLLLKWTSDLINRRNGLRSLLMTGIGPALAVALARLLMMVGHP